LTNYGPYGQTVGIPALIGGIDDGDSLRVEGLMADALTGAWRPQLRPGRYFFSSEAKSRYRYAKPETVTVSAVSGQNALTLSVDAPGVDTFLSPVLIAGLTQMCQTVRFAQPVPPSNVIEASTFIQPSFLQDPASPSQVSSLSAGDQLWWMPLFGGQVLAVHRSRRPRSIDVLADSDAVLYEVSTPDQLTDDRCYCVDFDAGIVYGKVAQPFPAAPFGTGQPPMTYVTVAYPTESDPDLGLITDYADWSAYFTSNADFFTAYEGRSGERYYNPLRMEEVCVVDTDGLVRVRHGAISTVLPASVVLIGPSGPVLCTTNSVQGSAMNALLPDPTHGNALSSLPYGTTVVARYYVDNTYAVIGISAEYLRVRAFLPANATLSVQYEGDPKGLALPALEQPEGPDLNPLTRAVASGFLWYEDAGNALPVPIAVSGILQVSNPTPVFDPTTGAGETITLRARLLDPTGTAISGADLRLACNPSAHVTIEATDVTSGDDGVSLFRLKLTSDASGVPISVTVADGRAPSQALATTILLPLTLGSTWEPSVFVSLCEDYLSVGEGTDAVTKRIVRAAVVMPDGFPWKGPAPSQLVLTSTSSAFYAPQGQADASLGAQVALSCDSPSDMMSAATVMSVGYAPVAGDILSATFYTGDSAYRSLPVRVS
jgi:hypothetical protein